MKKYNGKTVSIKEMVEGIEYSPYFNIASKILWRNNIDDPNIADLFDAFHEIAKVDNIVNKKGDKKYDN